MLNIYQNNTNELIINSLYEKVTIPDASLHYVFSFTDFYNNEVIAVLTDHSSTPNRYSKFYFTDGSDGTLRANGEYNIYESPIDSSTIDASIMNLLTNGQYTFWGVEVADFVYEPSVYTQGSRDSVFSPIFNPGASPAVTTVDHDELANRDNPSNHPWAIADVSLGSEFYWNNGYLKVDASAAGTVTFNYVDGSLAARDLSINELSGKIADIDTYQAIQDVSILTALSQSGVSLAYVDGSLAARDLSINKNTADIDQNTIDISQNASDILQNSSSVTDVSARVYTNSTYITTIQGEQTTQDSSIVDLRNNINDVSTRIPVDFYSKSYVDASLNAKQDTIADGTYVKEASLGEGLYWVGGLLDVSVEGGGTGDVTKVYVDGSLGARDIIISQNTNDIAQNTNDIADVSVRIPTDFYSKAYVDGSLGARDTSIVWLEANTIQDVSTLYATYPATGRYDPIYSLNGSSLTLRQLVTINNQGINIQTDGSVDVIFLGAHLNNLIDVSVFTDHESAYDGYVLGYSYNGISSKWVPVNPSSFSVTPSYVDGSLSLRDTSISWLDDNKLGDITQLGGGYGWFNKDGATGNSINTYTFNASTGFSLLFDLNGTYYFGVLDYVSKTYVDGSLNAKQDIIEDGTYVKEASIGDGLYWVSGQLDVSVAGEVTKDYVDGSLNTKSPYNTSINVQTSAYTLLSSDNNKVIDASGTWTLTLPNSLDTGFQVSIVNTGTGIITLDASNLLTMDSSVKLSNQYAGASAVHKGSGTWYAWGLLK